MAICHLESKVWAKPQENYSHVRHQIPQKEHKLVVGSHLPDAILADPSLADQQPIIPKVPRPYFGDRLTNIKHAPTDDEMIMGMRSTEPKSIVDRRKAARKLHWEKDAAPQGDDNTLAEDDQHFQVNQRDPSMYVAMFVPRRLKVRARTAKATEAAETNGKVKRSVDATVSASDRSDDDLDSANSFGIGVYGPNWYVPQPQPVVVPWQWAPYSWSYPAYNDWNDWYPWGGSWWD